MDKCWYLPFHELFSWLLNFVLRFCDLSINLCSMFVILFCCSIVLLLYVVFVTIYCTSIMSFPRLFLLEPGDHRKQPHL